jgi:hypothetical protein
MRRTLWILIALLLVVAAGGFLAFGAFPPPPKTQLIQKVLPNDRFQPRG